MRLKSIHLMVSSLVLMLVATTASADLSGHTQMQDEIKEDAPNGFTNVLSKTWIVKDNSAACVELHISPAGAFSITRREPNKNEFNVRIRSTSALLSPFGEIEQFDFQSLGCSTAELHISEEVGAAFSTSVGVPLNLKDLQSDHRVKNFKVVASPSQFATFVRIEGNKAFYKRQRGYGFEPVTVTLTFQFEDRHPSKYTATLPTRDDGYRLEKELIVEDIKEYLCDDSSERIETQRHSTEERAKDALYDKMVNIAKARCDRLIAIRTHQYGPLINSWYEEPSRSVIDKFYCASNYRGRGRRDYECRVSASCREAEMGLCHLEYEMLKPVFKGVGAPR